MPEKISTQKPVQLDNAIPQDNVDVYQNCGNIDTLIWLKHGDDYNDFGFRHCPFCGLLTDELTGNVIL